MNTLATQPTFPSLKSIIQNKLMHYPHCFQTVTQIRIRIQNISNFANKNHLLKIYRTLIRNEERYSKGIVFGIRWGKRALNN